jgi:hypothetical protein
MMEKSGFFNSSGGDRVYNAADFASYFGKLVSNGIFTRAADNLKVIPRTGLSVYARPGSAWINGYFYENTSDLELSLETANGVNPRIDRIVLRWSATDRSIKLAVKTGAASATPSPPALTRNSDVYELGLADITVGKGAVTVGVNDITDSRLNSSLCGTVNSLIGAVYE